MDLGATIIDINSRWEDIRLGITEKKGVTRCAVRDGRESGSRNHIIRLSVENFNLLNYLSIYTCCHSSSVIALISEDLLGNPIDLHHFRIALSVTPKRLPI